MKLTQKKATEIGGALVDAAIVNHQEKKAQTVIWCSKMNVAMALDSLDEHEKYGYEIIAEVVE
tara:strand:+ start:223 stop:411 length:189 start_codon:yes stop_codon:yes gene_type:complete